MFHYYYYTDIFLATSTTVSHQLNVTLECSGVVVAVLSWIAGMARMDKQS